VKVEVYDPRVPMVPRVSYDTASITVRCVPVPATGTVSAGSGTVRENPTRGIPVANPKHHLFYCPLLFQSLSICVLPCVYPFLVPALAEVI